MLGLIYIFAVAKPISIRRLSLLFGATLVAANCVYGVTHVANPPRIALETASALTILAWLAPLARAVGNSMTARQLVLDALDSASRLVQITYGSAVGTLLLMAFETIVHPRHPHTLGVLMPTWLVSGLTGLVLLNAIKDRHWALVPCGSCRSSNLPGNLVPFQRPKSFPRAV